MSNLCLLERVFFLYRQEWKPKELSEYVVGTKVEHGGEGRLFTMSYMTQENEEMRDTK